MPKYRIEVRNSDDELIAILEHAHNIRYMQKINEPHELIFRLPADDDKIENIALANEFWLRDNSTNEVVRKFKLHAQRDYR
jgi:predicted small metal-binding protein